MLPILMAGSQASSQPLSNQQRQIPAFRGKNVYCQELISLLAANLKSDAPAQLGAGHRALAAGMVSLAIDCFERSEMLDPTCLAAVEGQVAAYSLQGDLDQAIKACHRILELSPEDETGQFNLAVLLTQAGKLDQAKARYEALLAAKSDNFRAWHNLAALQQSLGQLMQAKQAWAKALEHAAKMAPADAAAAWRCYGETLADLDDPTSAMDAFAQSIKLQDDDSVTWLNLASSAHAAGSLGRAIVAARRAAKIAPSNPEIWAKLGDMMLELHRGTNNREHLAEALIAWKKSLAIDPDQPKLLEYIRTYERAGIH